MLGPKATKNCLENLATNENGNWSSFQLANRAPPLGVTGSPIAPSARMLVMKTHCSLVVTLSTRTYAWERLRQIKAKDVFQGAMPLKQHARGKNVMFFVEKLPLSGFATPDESAMPGRQARRARASPKQPPPRETLM